MTTVSFLDDNKKFVWKIKLIKEVDKRTTLEILTGVCIRYNGTILTRAFDNTNMKRISVFNVDALKHSVLVIANNYEDGLALLRVEDGKKDAYYDFVNISRRTDYILSEEFHAILYKRNFTNPVCLKGFLANECKGDRGIVKFLREDDYAYPEHLGPNVPVLQIGGLGASNECRFKSKTYELYNFHGCMEGRGCPLFERSGTLAGVVSFQKSRHDFAIHAKFINEFVSKWLAPLPPADEEKRMRKRKR